VSDETVHVEIELLVGQDEVGIRFYVDGDNGATLPLTPDAARKLGVALIEASHEARGRDWRVTGVVMEDEEENEVAVAERLLS
jgi:hypothetical protein